MSDQHDPHIGVEAATLASLEYADQRTEPLKLHLARAAQVIIDIRDGMERAFAGEIAPNEDDRVAHKMEIQRCEAALQHIVEADGNAHAALHAALQVERRATWES